MADQDHIQQLQQGQARVPFRRNPRIRASVQAGQDDEGVGAAQSHLLVVPVQAPGSRHTGRHPGSRQATVKRPQMACSSCSVRAHGHKHR